MARSTKYRSFFNIVCRAQVWFRSISNRKARRLTKVKLLVGRYEELPHPKTFGNEWGSPRDGTGYYIGDMKLFEPVEYKKLMRR